MSAHLPSSLAQSLTVARYEIHKYLRGMKIYVMLALMALMIGLTLFLPPLFGGSVPTDPMIFMSQLVSQVKLLIVISAVLFVSDALTGEFENRTGFLIFPRPIRRGTLFMGKYMASFAIVSALIALYFGVAALLSIYYTGSIYAETLTSLGMALLFIAGCNGLAFLISAIMKRGNTAAVLLFALFLIIMELFLVIVVLNDIDPIVILSYAGGAIDIVIPSSLPLPPGAIIIPPIDRGVASAVMAAWAVLCSIPAALIFGRREL